MKMERKKNKLVSGIGINDYEYVVYVNGKALKSYATIPPAAILYSFAMLLDLGINVHSDIPDTNQL